MIAEDFRSLLIAVAGAGAALTGLLFVAMSVAPRRHLERGPRVILQIRTAAALLSFTNALAVSLFGLVPQTNVGYPAVVLGVIGVAFTAASVRSIVATEPETRHTLRQLGLIILLLMIFGTELIAGILAIARPGSSDCLETIGYALVLSLIFGISRAWELVGDIDTGLWASLAVIAGRPVNLRTEDTVPGEAAGGARAWPG